MRTRFGPLLLLATAFASLGCASATKRFEQGQELEQQGRSAEAARRYLDALRKDGNLGEARTRLQESGSRAADEGIRRADAMDISGNAIDAAELLREADDLIRGASEVGVSLRVPSQYGQTRARILGRAVEESITGADAAVRDGRFGRAIEMVERAAELWEPQEGQRVAITRVLRDAQLAWSRSELSAGRFKSAFARADAARLVPGADIRALDALQSEAMRRGRIRVAALPAGARAGAATRILPELNDLLALDYWQQSPQWIAVANPIEAQRVVRTRGLAGRDIDPQDAASLGRQLDARYAVTFTLDSVRHTESGVERRRRTVKTRAGVDTAYTEEEGDVETWVRVSWRVVDVRGGRAVLERGDANARATTRFEHATFEGDWRDLELTSAARARFGQRDEREDREAVRQISRRLAGRLGPDVFAALLRRVE